MEQADRFLLRYGEVMAPTGHGRGNFSGRSGTRVRVGLVEDHPVFREGLVRCLSEREGIQVVGSAADADEMWGLVDRAGPEVLLLDLQLPGTDGIELAEQLNSKQPGIRVVVLTAFSEPDRITRAYEVGASAYILKAASPGKIQEIILRVAGGEVIVDGDVASRVFLRFQQGKKAERAGQRLAYLSRREEEVLRLMASGQTNRQIGSRLCIAEQTVKNHVASIFRKLQVEHRTSAAVLAVRSGIVPEEDESQM